jgi:mono/diheme cytochrome c family protein
MSAVRPLLIGLAVGVATFAAVVQATRGGGDRGAAPPQPTPATRAADADAGRLVFARMGCGSCHRLAAAGSSGQIGPPLDQVLPHHTRRTLLAKIRDPGGSSIMPEDFAQRMSAGELRALVEFLVAARAATPTD